MYITDIGGEGVVLSQTTYSLDKEKKHGTDICMAFSFSPKLGTSVPD